MEGRDQYIFFFLLFHKCLAKYLAYWINSWMYLENMTLNEFLPVPEPQLLSTKWASGPRLSLNFLLTPWHFRYGFRAGTMGTRAQSRNLQGKQGKNLRTSSQCQGKLDPWHHWTELLFPQLRKTLIRQSVGSGCPNDCSLVLFISSATSLCFTYALLTWLTVPLNHRA